MSEPKIVIGAGAAGLTAAAVCAERGGRVLLIEKMERPGRKLRITGKGRCNVTNATFDLQGLLEHIPTNPRFLYSAFSNFMPYDTIALMEDLGVPTKIERGERVFPVSDNATDIVDALVRRAKNAGVQFLQGTVERLELTEDGRRVQAVHLTDGRRLTCHSVAVCTGGCSYPATGSTGDGYTFARQCGHTIVPIRPALVPLVCDNNFIPELQGLSLRNVEIRVTQGNKEVYTDFGEMLFTHYGVSGPVVLSASSHLTQLERGVYNLHIDLKPALAFDVLDRRVQRDFSALQNKDLINALAAAAPEADSGICTPQRARTGQEGQSDQSGGAPRFGAADEGLRCAYHRLSPGGGGHCYRRRRRCAPGVAKDYGLQAGGEFVFCR